MQNRKIELLAPAGNMDALKAAVAAGCDAVYLGSTLFSARAFAGNFDHDQMIEAIRYCHDRDVRVYVTMNTLLYERTSACSIGCGSNIRTSSCTAARRCIFIILPDASS